MVSNQSVFEWAEDTKATRTRAEQIFARFVVFHKANPGVWKLFERFTLQAIASGRKAYSSDCICHRIRWHQDIETHGESVKLNDHYTAYYARMFHAAYPQHDGFFRNRKRTSEDRGEYATDLSVNHTGDPMGEDDLLKSLKELIGYTE